MVGSRSTGTTSKLHFPMYMLLGMSPVSVLQKPVYSRKVRQRSLLLQLFRNGKESPRYFHTREPDPVMWNLAKTWSAVLMLIFFQEPNQRVHFMNPQKSW